jgi:tetratricopeptide (TPR) repeat protein
MSTDASFDAFISYRRSDGASVAHWLRQRLEQYKAPHFFSALRKRKLKIYLDTSYERSTQDFYEQNIGPALANSRFLIVIATPAALIQRKSGIDWMEREIGDFLAQGGENRILVVRGAGDTSALLPARLLERFPNIEIVDLRGASRWSILSISRSSRLNDELLKLLAVLLDVQMEDMPRLKQEQERRQQVRMGASIGIGTSLVLLALAAAVVSLKSLNRAEMALSDGIYTTENVISSIDNGMPLDGDPNGLRGGLLNTACDLRSKLLLQASKIGDWSAHATCELETSRAFEANGEYAKAALILKTLSDSTGHRAEDDKTVTSALLLLKAHRWQLDFLDRHNTYGDQVTVETSAALEKAAFDAKFQDDEDYFRAVAQIQSGRANVLRVAGKAAFAQHDLDKAILKFRAAIAVLESIRFHLKSDVVDKTRIQLDIIDLYIDVSGFEFSRNRLRENKLAKEVAGKLLKDLSAIALDDKILESDISQTIFRWKSLP